MSVKIEITIEQLGNSLWKYKIANWTPGFQTSLTAAWADLWHEVEYEAKKQQRAS